MAFSVPHAVSGSAAKVPTLLAVPPSTASLEERLLGLRSHRCAQDAPAATESSVDPCPHCGGSGMLRTTVQSHRTCLECLGGGQRLLTSAELLRHVGLRAVGSASGGR